MVERREGHFKGHDGLELFYQSWTRADARGTLVITHGLAEHSECYARTADSLNGLGWNICAWDMRGHGRSEGKRGFVGDFHHYAMDLSRLLIHLAETGRLKDPFALLGHSLGGLVTLRHLTDEDPSCPKPRALALSSPLLGVALPVPAIKDFASRILNRVLPEVTLYNEIKYEDLTRDTEILKTYGQDPLRHDKISAPLYLGMMANMEVVKAKAERIKIPTIIQAAGTDKIVSLQATRDLFERLGSENRKLIVYDDNYHEIFNDLDRKKVFTDLDAFLGPVMRR